MNFKEMGVDSFPLSWPTGWKRTTARVYSRFHTAFSKAREHLFHELKLLGVGDHNVILSTNLPLRKDGLPYSGQANPNDPGVAVYFRLKERPMVLACDQYRDVKDNLYAIAKTVEALRGIDRWGASDMMERSFTGFQALPAPKNDWWEVLEVPKGAGPEQIKKARNALAMLHHPDNGGDPDMMAKVNKAFEQAMEDK